MRWTGLFFVLVTAALAGAKQVGIQAIAVWEWWQVALPATFYFSLWGLIVVGTAIHAVTRRLIGFDDSRGVD